MWSKTTTPLETWLVKKETVVESYEPIGYDISYVKGQSEDAQVGTDSPGRIVFHFWNSQSVVMDIKVLPVHHKPHKERKLCEVLKQNVQSFKLGMFFRQ